MDFSPYTRQVEECRKRWNRQALQFVLGVAKIVRKARDAAEHRRQWNRWLRHQLHVDPSTICRYLSIECLVSSNIDLNQHLKRMTISKLYALSRLPSEKARELILGGVSHRMSDLQFLKLTRRILPHRTHRSSIENLTRQMDAAVRKVQVSVQRWRDSELAIPPHQKARIRRQLHALSELLHRMELKTAAM